MKCLTCNNKGIVPDMTSAVDGEGNWDTEICPDCHGESRGYVDSNIVKDYLKNHEIHDWNWQLKHLGKIY